MTRKNARIREICLQFQRGILASCLAVPNEGAGFRMNIDFPQTFPTEALPAVIRSSMIAFSLSIQYRCVFRIDSK